MLMVFVLRRDVCRDCVEFGFVETRGLELERAERGGTRSSLAETSDQGGR